MLQYEFWTFPRCMFGLDHPHVTTKALGHNIPQSIVIIDQKDFTFMTPYCMEPTCQTQSLNIPGQAKFWKYAAEMAGNTWSEHNAEELSRKAATEYAAKLTQAE